MKRYIVTRQLLVDDTCVVSANTKAEAIRKAKVDDFHAEVDDEAGAWEVGGVEKVFESSYRAEQDGEIREDSQ